MRPSARELIDGIAESLRTRIAPLVADDAWAASELRSIDALLAHLAVRVELEAACLHADNADVRDVLERLVTDVDGGRDIVGPVLDEPDAGTYVGNVPTTEALHARNLAYHTALERVIHVLHADGHPQLDMVREYLVRATERERDIYEPLTARPMF
jgi:hypothetical protein